MKRISIILLTCLFFIFCACENAADTPAPSDSETNFSSKTQSFTKDCDGVMLTVTVDKSEYTFDSLITVTATVKNNTDKTVGLLMPVMGTDSHTAVTTIIENKDGQRLIDTDTFGKSFDTALSSVKIEPDKEYVQEMKFETFTGVDKSSRKPADKGKYSGLCTIKILSDPENTGSQTSEYSVSFDLTIK